MFKLGTACFIHSSRLSLHQSFEFLWESSRPWERSSLYIGTIALWCYFSATVLSFCSRHVLSVETGGSNSCLNCSLTGRRCWENQTVTTLSPLHCTAFSSLFLCSLPSPSLSLFFLPDSFSFYFGPLIQYCPLLKWQVSEGLLLYWLKTVTFRKKSQPTSHSSWHISTLQTRQRRESLQFNCGCSSLPVDCKFCHDFKFIIKRQIHLGKEGCQTVLPAS